MNKYGNYIYFAYGSNMLLERLEERVGKVKVIGTYSLKGYKMLLNCGFHETFANIQKTGNKKDIVEGVLYDLYWWQIRILDSYEGFYKRYKLSEKDATFYVYISYSDAINTKNTKPSLYYLNILLEGALRNKLYTTYNSLVDYKNDRYPLRKGNRYKKIPV
jgi:gamma-glutamylcyclotransferase